MAQIIDVPNHGKIEFPDSMSDEQIVSAIKGLDSTSAPETNQTSWNQRQKEIVAKMDAEEASQERVAKNREVIQDLKNFGAGALSLIRGALNIGNEAYNDTKRHTNPAIAPAKQKLQPKEMLGDKLLLPKGTDKESGAYGFGTIFDPASLAIGGGVSKVLPYAPVIGGSFKQGVTALEQGVTALGKNMLSGGVTGGIIGGLSEDGNAVDGAMAGSAANVAIPALLKTGGFFGKKGIELFDPILSIEGKQRAAARVANAAAGNTGNKAQIADLLTQAKLGQTAADVVLPTKNSEMIALQMIVGNERPDLVINYNDARKLTATKAINKIARTPEIYDAAFARRKEITEPMRKSAMQAAGQADRTMGSLNPRIEQKQESIISALQGKGQLETEAAIQKNLAQGGKSPSGGLSPSAYPVMGMQRIPNQYTHNFDRIPEFKSGAGDMDIIKKQRQAERDFMIRQVESLKDYGLKPLNVNSIKSSISNRMKQPGEGIGLDANVLNGISKELDRIKSVKGQVYPEDLHEIRKKGINDILEKLNTGTPGSTQKRAAGVAKDIRDKIDSVLDDASGGSWTPYLKEFQKRSKLMDNIKIGEDLQDVMESEFGKQRSQALGTKIKYMKNTIDPETGNSIYDGLSSGNKKTLDRVRLQFINETRTQSLEKQGIPAALKTLRATESPIQSVPNRLSFETTAFNALIKAIQGRGGERTNRELASLMYTNPKLLGELMKNGQTPNATIKKVTDVLMRTQAAGIANYTQQGEQ